MVPDIVDEHDVVDRTRGELADELAAELAATGGSHSRAISVAAVHTRPALLRQVARLLAEQLTGPVDRIVASESDTAMATAVALHTGIPFATVDADRREIARLKEHVTDAADEATVRGELYPGEDVVVVGTVASPESERLQRFLIENGYNVSSTIFVLVDQLEYGDAPHLFRVANGTVRPSTATVEP
ncbi:hypothetical protein [Rhodococcus sp. NPDC055024]